MNIIVKDLTVKIAAVLRFVSIDVYGHNASIVTVLRFVSINV